MSNKLSGIVFKIREVECELILKITLEIYIFTLNFLTIPILKFYNK